MTRDEIIDLVKWANTETITENTIELAFEQFDKDTKTLESLKTIAKGLVEMYDDGCFYNDADQSLHELVGSARPLI